MKYLLCIATLFVVVACKKEIRVSLAVPCHGDTAKPLVITAPYFADTLRYGQMYETTWIGKIGGATKYAVILHWKDYSTSESFFQMVGDVHPSECSFAWKVHSDMFGTIHNDNCYILFAGNSVPGYVESVRFSIRP
ncbi:MAG: hypothetical protein KBB91_00185 [Candidatus Pacebacteria bacterium]|nr:hypothetical protein [Candidatus Paceibacterota bacterium]MBP9700811.1 hypothetical protein [Candidatus Paceibacterota bacterium]